MNSATGRGPPWLNCSTAAMPLFISVSRARLGRLSLDCFFFAPVAPVNKIMIINAEWRIIGRVQTADVLSGPLRRWWPGVIIGEHDVPWERGRAISATLKTRTTEMDSAQSITIASAACVHQRRISSRDHCAEPADESEPNREPTDKKEQIGRPMAATPLPSSEKWLMSRRFIRHRTLRTESTGPTRARYRLWFELTVLSRRRNGPLSYKSRSTPSFGFLLYSSGRATQTITARLAWPAIFKPPFPIKFCTSLGWLFVGPIEIPAPLCPDMRMQYQSLEPHVVVPFSMAGRCPNRMQFNGLNKNSTRTTAAET